MAGSAVAGRAVFFEHRSAGRRVSGGTTATATRCGFCFFFLFGRFFFGFFGLALVFGSFGSFSVDFSSSIVPFSENTQKFSPWGVAASELPPA